jgi:prepilin-type processing-associated H-X9-DG protein
MGTGYTMYMANSRGHLMHFVWWGTPPLTPDYVWYSYWPGILDSHAVRGDVLLCPAAYDPATNAAGRGYGTSDAAWAGRLTANGSPIRFNATTYRDGSYGINRYLTLTDGTSGFGPNGSTTKITGVRNLCDVPLFMDCIWVDVQPQNGSATLPVESPPNLVGNLAYPGAGGRTDQPEHWRFLLARHARGINMCMADGSARWVRLDETYMLRWREPWVGYRLKLPGR